MRAAICAVLALTSFGSLASQTTGDPPKLLLTPQRLRRLQRDRERQTVRWTNFENRVKTVPESTERGFELALYYAVTHDPQRGHEGIEWTKTHFCDTRQRALILDWVRDLIGPEDRNALTAGRTCATSYKNATPRLRDALLLQIALGGDVSPSLPAEVLKELRQQGLFRSPEVLYSACEYLLARSSPPDLDDEARRFFAQLPAEMLLALKPDQVEHPDWMTHVAALAAITLDSNLPASQYLQSWAMEDRQTLQEGPGVGYEFLWADPYLPGVGYQNRDPWIYDSAGRLFVRSTWDADACWIHISTRGVEQERCPAGWRNSPQTFGHLRLVPMTANCVEVAPHSQNDAVILWQLQPGETVTYRLNKRQMSLHSDAAGLLLLEARVEGKVCRAR